MKIIAMGSAALMDGFALLSKLREEQPELTVLALSGVVPAGEVAEHEFDGFIDKPVNLEEFRRVIEDALDQDDA